MNSKRVEEILRKKLPVSPICLMSDNGEHDIKKCEIENHRKYNAIICLDEGCLGMDIVKIEQGFIMVSCSGYGHNYTEIISGGRPKVEEVIGAGNGGKR